MCVCTAMRSPLMELVADEGRNAVARFTDGTAVELPVCVHIPDALAVLAAKGAVHTSVFVSPVRRVPDALAVLAARGALHESRYKSTHAALEHHQPCGLQSAVSC